jgi:hypothetical protein
MPVVDDVTGWSQSPIDQYVLAQLKRKGLTPSSPASREVLLRRVTIDLTGLPPTPEELRNFLNDTSPDAYERVVDRLLESPRFGERWARHWLDLVRYADTGGYKWDQFRPEAYRYRDYVIEAFNTDLSYDHFVRHQIAGDELEPESADALIATGFVRLYPEEASASNFVESRQHILDDVTEVTGLAFMGLTLGCAKCHDHKFDPILQKDFYRLQACFAAMLPADNIPALSGNERDEYDKKMAVWQEATRDIRQQIAKLTDPIRTAATNETAMAYDPETREALTTPPEQRNVRQRQLAALTDLYIDRIVVRRVKRMEGEAKEDYDELQTELAKFDAIKPAIPPLAMATTDAVGKPPETCILEAGDFRKPGAPVSPGFPEFLGDHDPTIAPPEDRPESTGRRAALAMWLTRADHPLTARVMANRIWQHHMGAGIIPTSNDFGAMGEPASHRELLDWLASELVERDWSLKYLHRMIVTSATYRQSSEVDSEDAETMRKQSVDPANRWLWRANRRRLEGETLRDAMLAVSGTMNFEMNGPSVKPPLPQAVVETSKYAWQADPTPASHVRRSVYVLAQRNLRFPFFTAFDAPDAYQSCAARAKTVTAPQALSMLNGTFAQTTAQRWSGAILEAGHVEPKQFVAQAYQQAFGRCATAAEIAEAVSFIEDQAEAVRSGPEIDDRSLPFPYPAELVRHQSPAEAAALVDFCQALFNSSEFLFVD